MNRALVPSEVRRQRFEAWVAEYSDAVLRTCYVYLADIAAAEDALQETFLKVWRNMDSFEGRNGSSGNACRTDAESSGSVSDDPHSACLRRDKGTASLDAGTAAGSCETGETDDGGCRA